MSRHGITAKESDKILAALRLGWSVEVVAASFQRSTTTIDNMRECAGIRRQRLPYRSVGGAR